MRNLLFASLMALSFTTSAFAAGTTKAETKSQLPLIHVAELEKMMAEDKTTTVFDANKDNTREKEGLIPGAKVLTTVSSYDLSFLPTDKKTKLVFYCANTMCTASHDAAKRAIQAGYSNVMVMSDGIQGWKKAGKPTEAFKKN